MLTIQPLVPKVERVGVIPSLHKVAILACSGTTLLYSHNLFMQSENNIEHETAVLTSGGLTDSSCLFWNPRSMGHKETGRIATVRRPSSHKYYRDNEIKKGHMLEACNRYEGDKRSNFFRKMKGEYHLAHMCIGGTIRQNRRRW
jgi:hypothetical protein